MRDLTHSYGRFAWVLSLFGLQQLSNLIEGKADDSVEPRYDPVKAFDHMSHTAKSYLGNSLQQVFQSGESILRTLFDGMLGSGSSDGWPDLNEKEEDMHWPAGAESPRAPEGPWPGGEESFGSSWPGTEDFSPKAPSWDAGQETPSPAPSPAPSPGGLSPDPLAPVPLEGEALRWVGEWGPMPKPAPTGSDPSFSTAELDAVGQWGPMPTLPSMESPPDLHSRLQGS